MPVCLKKERKPIVPLKPLDIIFLRRTGRNSQYYFTNRIHALPRDGEKKEKPKRTAPFRVPSSGKILSYIRYSDRKEKLISKNRLALPLPLKDNFKMAASRDISRRLYIPEPPNEVKTVIEIHPEFYNAIEGRPLRSFDDIKVYLNNIRNYAMNRQQIGYRRDLILKIDQSIQEETKEHDAILAELKQHIKNFQKFLTEDYKKACAKVAKTEKLYADVVAKTQEFLGYVSSLTVLNNIIFKLDAIRNVLKMYRSYLIYVAPLPWRQQYDETLRDKLQSIQFEAGEFFTDNDLVETLDIDKTVELAKIELKRPLPNHMYFTDPEQMMYIFRNMELQSREYLTQLSKTDAPFRLLQDKIKQLKRATKQELDYFQYYIDNINNEIERELYNEHNFREKFFRILNETFFDYVASPATLKLKICIEYVYERIFGKCEEGHASLHDPMKILEVLYEDYNLRLDGLDFKIVTQAQKDCFAQDLKMMKNAYKAQRELKAFKEMTDAMNRAFLPPAKYKPPVFTKFIDRKTRIAMALAEREKRRAESGSRAKRKVFKVTPEEREGLTLFTHWCDGMNPEPFLKDYETYAKPVFLWEPTEDDTDF